MHFLETVEMDLVVAYTAAELRVVPRHLENYLHEVMTTKLAAGEDFPGDPKAAE